MNQKTVYEERLTARWMIATFGLLAFVFLFLALFQTLRGPVGPEPAPTWLFLVLFLLFSAIGFNFRRLVIRISEEKIRVSYGLVRRVIPTNTITDCYSSRAYTLRYGGWGVRIWRSGKGGWILVYSVGGTSLVVLALKKGKVKEFLFSTKQMERVIETVRALISP
jgi:hypothetical protein